MCIVNRLPRVVTVADILRDPLLRSYVYREPLRPSPRTTLHRSVVMKRAGAPVA
jgi:hypothetical protein